MNIKRLCTLVLLGGLCWSAANVHATDVAGRPLKASVLAKPNLLIGYDDSTSMDAEVLFDTNEGMLYWSISANTAWFPDGTLISAGDDYAYLFPEPLVTPALLRLSSNGGIPPTRQFAFARSSAYNPLYYDTMATYKPWSAGYYDNALHRFSDANPVAVLSHPVWGTEPQNLTTTWCVANLFTFRNGMIVDKEQRTGTNCATIEPVDRTIYSSGVEHVTIAYYPATFWQVESCAVVTGDANCAYAPGRTKTLKRYEIKVGNSFPSGRSYADELQNFANWYQYHRKRRLMMPAALGTVLEIVGGMRVGTVAFHATKAPTMYDVDTVDQASNFLAATGEIYKVIGTSGTPTRPTLNYIGQQFMTNRQVVQYACQRNNAVIATDGYPSSLAVEPPSYDQTTWGSGAPYATTEKKTMADLALAYYTLNLRPDLATGRVPTSAADANPDLHMNTYGLSLGVKGTLWPASAVPAASTTAYPWPLLSVSSGKPAGLDELWHATINGRGQMYLATNPTNTAAALQSAFDDMQAQVGGQAGASVSSINLAHGDNQAYVTNYNVKGWMGELSAHTISSATGVVNTSKLWSASDLLAARDWTTRVIATFDGRQGTRLLPGSSTLATLLNPGNVYGNTGSVMNYLRGERTGEGTTWRKRYGLLGALINAAPVVSSEDSVVYQAGNEGMLHAFDSKKGSELWAYIPYNVLPALGKTTQRSYRFSTLLDGTPTLVDTGSKKILLGGLGTGGSGWYALDVSKPGDITSSSALASRALWEFPNADTSPDVRNTLGLAVGAPRIVRIKGSNTWTALVSSGYNNAAQDGKGRLFLLDAGTGVVQATLVANAGVASIDPGFAQFTPYYEDDGSVQYVYGGDELGNLWRFDLVDRTVKRLAVLKDANGTAQPITAAPALVQHEGQRVVFVGTGRLLGLNDLSTTPDTQSLYAIADGTELTNPRGKLTQQIYNASADSLTSNSVNWTGSRGWYIDLPSGEVVNTTPALGFNALVAVTNKSAIADCSASSRHYVIDMRSGSSMTGIGYVGKTLSNTDMSSRMTLLRTSGTAAGSASGSSTTNCGTGGIAGMTTTASGQTQTQSLNLCQAIPSRKNAWTEIRR